MSCEKYDIIGMVATTSDGVNKRFDVSMEKNKKMDSVCVFEKESYTFYCCSDIHFKNSANNYCNMMHSASNEKVDFVIINGDITDQKGGLSDFWQWQKSCDGTDIKKFYSIGNHDLFFNQWREYKEIYGSTVYWFTVKSNGGVDLFICLDSGNATFGYKQHKWLEDLLKKQRGRYRHCIVFTHTNMWLTDGSQFPSGSYSTKETVWLAGLLAKYDVDLMIQGHDHTRDECDMDGVKYITLDAIKDDNKNASYLRVVCSEKIEYEFVNL